MMLCAMFGGLIMEDIITHQVIRVAVFAEGSDAEEAQAAGADIVGGVELIEEIASKIPVLLLL